MTQKELIEVIQQHHPSSNETAIRKALNRAQDDFAAKTKIIDAVTEVSSDDNTVVGQRYYPLPPDILEIKRVELENISIPRMIGKPVEGDIT